MKANTNLTENYVHSVSNHTKLVRRGDNPNKKTFMYISYVSCIHWLNIHKPYKLNRLD